MKRILTLLGFTLLCGCSSYSERGVDEGSRETGKSGYTVRCDASPPNQPGCYQPRPFWSFWPSDRFKFEVRQQ